jgi:SAM-dependent methyltransferase
MNRATVLALDAINRDFYDARAEEFSATREAPWPGWSRLLEPLQSLTTDGAGELRILDVGCGSGRLARWLRERSAPAHRYVGVDRSLRVMSLGSAGTRPAIGRPAPAWLLADLLDSDGRLPCRDAAFDAVVAFGLFHHLPSFALRRAVAWELVRLVRPGGLAAVAHWQFADEPRFERRFLSWDWAAGVDPGQLEPGDHLLRWGETSAPAPMRYCHHTDPAEAERLTEGLGADIVTSFRADGRSGRLNLYRVLRRAAVAVAAIGAIVLALAGARPPSPSPTPPTTEMGRPRATANARRAVPPTRNQSTSSR